MGHSIPDGMEWPTIRSDKKSYDNREQIKPKQNGEPELNGQIHSDQNEMSQSFTTGMIWSIPFRLELNSSSSDSGKPHRCVKKVLRVFQLCFIGDSIVFSRSITELS